MTTADLFAAALVLGALAALAARSLEGLLQSLGRPTRWLWLVALLGSTALAIAAASRRPDRAITAPAAAAPSGTFAPTAPGGGLATSAALVRRSVAAPVEAALDATRGLVPAGAAPWLASLWALASLVALLALVGAYVGARRAAARLPARALLGHAVRVAPSAGPAVYGLVRPRVVVPAWLLERPTEEQRLALAHEAEHVRARDPVVLALGCALAALLPWHPAAWWMLARLRLAVEIDCDRRVLAAGASRLAYGSLLIDVSGRGAVPHVGAAALAHAPTHLERRLLAMTATRSRRAVLRAATVALLAPVCLLAACEAKLPSSAEVERMDVADAERRLTEARLATPESAAYLLDGRESTAAEVRAIPADRIATISIQKGDSRRIVSVTSKTDGETRTRDASAPSLPARMEVDSLARPRREFTGLLVIDGRKVDASRLGTMDPSAIERVDVIKGEHAVRLYPADAPAAKGVIEITTKAAAARKP